MRENKDRLERQEQERLRRRKLIFKQTKTSQMRLKIGVKIAEEKKKSLVSRC